MLTADDVRRIALAQVEAEEVDHFGMPSFRVGKKIFCTIHAPQHRRAMLKLDPEDQHNLADGDAIVPVPGYWGRKGSTFVDLDKVEARHHLVAQQHLRLHGERLGEFEALAAWPAEFVGALVCEFAQADEIELRPRQFALGFKLFYDEDVHRMRAAQVLAIRPRVSFVSFQ